MCQLLDFSLRFLRTKYAGADLGLVSLCQPPQMLSKFFWRSEKTLHNTFDGMTDNIQIADFVASYSASCTLEDLVSEEDFWLCIPYRVTGLVTTIWDSCLRGKYAPQLAKIRLSCFCAITKAGVFVLLGKIANLVNSVAPRYKQQVCIFDFLLIRAGLAYFDVSQGDGREVGEMFCPLRIFCNGCLAWGCTGISHGWHLLEHTELLEEFGQVDLEKMGSVNAGSQSLERLIKTDRAGLKSVPLCLFRPRIACPPIYWTHCYHVAKQQGSQVTRCMIEEDSKILQVLHCSIILLGPSGSTRLLPRSTQQHQHSPYLHSVTINKDSHSKDPRKSLFAKYLNMLSGAWQYRASFSVNFDWFCKRHDSWMYAETPAVITLSHQKRDTPAQAPFRRFS